MRHQIHCVLRLILVAGVAVPCATARAQGSAPSVRRLTVDDAVKLALEQNLGIQAERLNPQIEDVAVALSRTYWLPTLSSSFTNNSQNQPPTSALSGGQAKVTDKRVQTGVRIDQVLPTGATYFATWSSARATSSNIFTSYDPLLTSNAQFSVTQPLLRNFKIDNLRQQLEASRKDREAADVQLRSTVATTSRNVKNAYWDLAYAIDNLKAQQQSLDLAKRLLADNEKRVQIGTMAPLDIVEAQSEVARNEEAVIVAEAAIKQAEDRLRALIYDPSTPDFWTLSIEPTQSMSFSPQAIDVDAATRRALSNRTDVQLAKNSLERSQISLKYYRNQALPEVNAQATYQSNAAGGVFLSPLTSLPLGGGSIDRTILSQRGFGSVLGDVFSNAFPTWTVGVTVSYPLGAQTTSDANLARAKLQYTQAETQLKNIELQIATQVRDAARQVQTNQKRIDSARAARELAERRLDAEEKKFAAGIQTSFFVFQAQRDLAQARTNEVRALSDYNKSVVDFEAIQDASLTGTAPVTTVR